MSYLLHGLPRDLNEQERLQLRSALPTTLAQSTQASTPPTGATPDPSILHRAVTILIMSLCLILKFIIPYVKYLSAIAYNYERSHHIAEGFVDKSTTSINTLGKKSIELAGCAMGNEVVMRGVSYCVDGVCGGVSEGLGEGIKGVRAGDRILKSECK